MWCRDCQVEPDPTGQTSHYGAKTAVPRVNQTLDCSQWGSRNVDFVLTARSSAKRQGAVKAPHPLRKQHRSRPRRCSFISGDLDPRDVALGIFDPSLGIFDPARCRRNPDFLGGFPPKPRSVLRNRQGIPRLSGVSSRAHEGGMRGGRSNRRRGSRRRLKRGAIRCSPPTTR